jgi:hypothetical protein
VLVFTIADQSGPSMAPSLTQFVLKEGLGDTFYVNNINEISQSAVGCHVVSSFIQHPLVVLGIPVGRPCLIICRRRDTRMNYSAPADAVSGNSKGHPI